MMGVSAVFNARCICVLCFLCCLMYGVFGYSCFVSNFIIVIDVRLFFHVLSVSVFWYVFVSNS